MEADMNTGILTACMIVRNEEENIRRCLSSIVSLVDEIVVVDTGSTDNTVQIAESFGARVYHHPWQNDFSLHRNQALSYAQGQWVLIVDADEEIVVDPNSSPSLFRQFLNQVPLKFPALAIRLDDIQKGMTAMQFNSTRLFRKGKVKYSGIVHNQPQVSGQALFTDLVTVRHYGYDLSPDKKEAKFQRTKALLLKQVEQGEIKDGLVFFYLCQLFAEHRVPDQAVIWGEKYLEMYQSGKIEDRYLNTTIYFTMTKQYMKLGQQQQAQKWLELGVERLPGDLDLAMAALEYGIWTENPMLQISAAGDFIDLYQQYLKNPMCKRGKFVFCLRPEALAIAYARLTVVHLLEGGKALTQMMNGFSDIPIDFRKGLLQEIQEQLKDSKIPGNLVVDKPAEPIQTMNKNLGLTTMVVH